MHAVFKRHVNGHADSMNNEQSRILRVESMIVVPSERGVVRGTKSLSQAYGAESASRCYMRETYYYASCYVAVLHNRRCSLCVQAKSPI